MRADGREPVHNRAGSNMTWGVATALLEQRGEEGLFEVDEAWLPRVVDRARAEARRARQSLSRPARPLRRARAPRRRVGRDGRRARRAQRLRPQRRRPADRRPRPRREIWRRRAGVTYFGIEDPSVALAELQHAHDAKHCRRCGHPYDYARAFVGHLGHYAVPELRRRSPGPDVAATEIELRRDARLARADPHSGGRGLDRAAPPRSLQRLQRARGADGRAASGDRPRAGRRGAGDGRGRVRARRADRRRRNPRLDPADQEPGRDQRGPSHAPARGRDAPATGSISGSRSTTGSPTAAMCPGSGTPTSSCSRAPSGASICAGTRAPELALRLKYAGVEPERITVEESIERKLRPCRRRGRGPLYALPTYTALIELRTLLAIARPGAGSSGDDRRARADLARRRVRRLRGRPRALGAAGGASGGPVLELGPAPAGSRSSSRATATRSSRSTRPRPLLAALRERAAAARPGDREACWPTRARFGSIVGSPR